MHTQWISQYIDVIYLYLFTGKMQSEIGVISVQEWQWLYNLLYFFITSIIWRLIYFICFDLMCKLLVFRQFICERFVLVYSKITLRSNFQFIKRNCMVFQFYLQKVLHRNRVVTPVGPGWFLPIRVNKTGGIL